MSQPRDFRRMLYRFDLATKYESIPALIQHMMDETVLDGVLELRMITSRSSMESTSEPPLQLPSTFISFRREGREVNAVALYGPRSSRAPSSSPSSRSSTGRASTEPSNFPLEVKKRFASRTTLVWVFSPMVQRLLNEGATTVLFECRSYLASSEIAHEVRAADEAAAVAAAERRELEYRHPQQNATQQVYNQNATYDPNMYAWQQIEQQDPYAPQTQGGYSAPAVPSAWNPNATYHLTNMPSTGYSDQYGNQYPHTMSEQMYYATQPSTSYGSSQATPSYSHPPQVQVPPTQPPQAQRSQRSSNVSPPMAQRNPPPKAAPAPRIEKEGDPAIELLTRRAPFKRMVGYAGKQYDGSLAVYELSDDVAATAFTDGLSGIGMASVEAMGRGIRRTSHAEHGGHSSSRRF
ncbi:hypothetical protein RHS04_07189 [Rhizoctonia solani]|uniref:Uncharacterized protein n=1 Tax=Rhizoctonia solani TaxID=456999 RepID=A0A8H7H2U4_9AGAM|nr:hypothetical protein RHS04_07189 [Rhizoctonia solani]